MSRHHCFGHYPEQYRSSETIGLRTKDTLQLNDTNISLSTIYLKTNKNINARSIQILHRVYASHYLNQWCKNHCKAYVVRDLFPAGPISVIFVLLASISCYCDFFSKIDFWYRLWVPPQIFWWIHICEIKSREVVITTRREMAKTTLASG